MPKNYQNTQAQTTVINPPHGDNTASIVDHGRPHDKCYRCGVVADVAHMQGAALVAVRAHLCPRGRGRTFTLQLPPTLRAHALHHQSLLCRHLTGLAWGIMAMMQGLRSLSLAPPPAYTLSPASRATTTPHGPIATFENTTQNAPQALWITDGHKGRTLPHAGGVGPRQILPLWWRGKCCPHAGCGPCGRPCPLVDHLPCNNRRRYALTRFTTSRCCAAT